MTVTVPASLPVMSAKGVLPPGSLLGIRPHLLQGLHLQEVNWRF